MFISSYGPMCLSYFQCTCNQHAAGYNLCNVERWERSTDVICEPIVLLLKMLQKYPDYEQEVIIPEKEWPLRIWYMHGQDVCTLIDVNERSEKSK